MWRARTTELAGRLTIASIDRARRDEWIVASEGLAPGAPVPDPIRSRPGRLLIAVLVVGISVVGLLSWTSWSVYDRNESRLLELKAKEGSSVLGAALPVIQTPLTSASALAEATNGDPRQFQALMELYVGPGRPFVSASLWLLAAPGAGPVANVGAQPLLGAQRAGATEFLTHPTPGPILRVTQILGTENLRLGYTFNSGQPNRRFTAYGESPLPPNRRLPVAINAAFSDLRFALYLGRSERPAQLIETDEAMLPLEGRRKVSVVPFGDTAFLLVVTPRGTLGGTLPGRLPWIIGVFGTLLTLAVAVMTERLSQRRRHAVMLATDLDLVADENRKLYSHQRSIAQTLQQALLPEVLPGVDGLDACSRYVAGVHDIDIGGDWYDLIVVDDHNVLFVVGDVSGRGLPAAVVMAALRYAVRAYAVQGDSPGTILTKLSDLVSVERGGHFATVLCAQIDVERHQISVANAGHLPPLLISGESAEFVTTDVGLPVGVAHHPAYDTVTVALPAEATFLAFTDGLVERRGESLDAGLGRLQAAVAHKELSLEGLMASVVDELVRDGSDDDTAILGVRWHH